MVSSRGVKNACSTLLSLNSMLAAAVFIGLSVAGPASMQQYTITRPFSPKGGPFNRPVMVVETVNKGRHLSGDDSGPLGPPPAASSCQGDDGKREMLFQLEVVGFCLFVASSVMLALAYVLAEAVSPNKETAASTSLVNRKLLEFSSGVTVSSACMTVAGMIVLLYTIVLIAEVQFGALSFDQAKKILYSPCAGAYWVVVNMAITLALSIVSCALVGVAFYYWFDHENGVPTIKPGWGKERCCCSVLHSTLTRSCCWRCNAGVGEAGG